MPKIRRAEIPSWMMAIASSSSADDVVYQNLVIVEDPSSRIGMSLVYKNKSWLWHHVASAPNQPKPQAGRGIRILRRYFLICGQ